MPIRSCSRRRIGRPPARSTSLEREFGVNCMSAQQAIVWDALRRCGIKDRIEGFGRLFREF